MAGKMDIKDKIALGLVTLGAINWGLFGVFDINLVEMLLGTEIVATIVYGAIGIAGLLSAYTLYKVLK